MVDDGSALVGRLREAAGASLRTVVEYDREGYTLRFRRDDLEAEYTPARLDAIHHELVLGGIARRYLRDVFEDGDLGCAIYQFERSLVFHLPRVAYEGLFVAVDADAELSVLDFVQTCRLESGQNE